MAGSTYGTLFTMTTWGNPTGRQSASSSTDVRQGFLSQKAISRDSLTEGSPDRANIPLPAANQIRWRSSPACSKGAPPVLPSRSWCATRISVPGTTERSRTATVRDMPTIPLIPNTDSATIAAEDAPPAGRPSGGLPPEPSLPRCWISLDPSKSLHQGDRQHRGSRICL